jgi:AGZA family xanthine/uracil permease-like MFS transporter
MMMRSAADINWAYPGDAIPAFITLLIMPMTYSIAYGLIAGIITYILINGLTLIIEFLSGGRIVPYAKELKDPWTWKLPGGILPGWLVRLIHGKRDFWRPYPEDEAEYVERMAAKERHEVGEMEMEMEMDEREKK